MTKKLKPSRTETDDTKVEAAQATDTASRTPEGGQEARSAETGSAPTRGTPAGPKPPSAWTRFSAWFMHQWRENPLFSTILTLILMIIIQTVALGFDYPSFGDWFRAWTRNWVNILRNNSSVGIVAIGMTFVILSGGIDLAVGSTLVAVGALLMVLIDRSPMGLPASWGLSGPLLYALAMIVAIVFGFLLGEGTGVLVTRGKIPPFIVTLGTMKIFRSVTQQVMQTRSPMVPRDFQAIANTRIGGLMLLPIIYWLVLSAFFHFVSKQTAFGRHVYAVGSNERTARLAGVNTGRTTRLVYALTGAMVAVAAILQVARIGSMDYANAGSGYEMDAISAVVVGGTSMAGGRGSIMGTVLGVLIIGVINNLLNLIGVPPFLRSAFQGFIVIGAVLLQRKSGSLDR